jgi:hypothetical protein
VRFEPPLPRLPATALPVLPAGSSPAGIGVLATGIRGVLNSLSLAFFSKPEFCGVTALRPVDDPHAVRSEFAAKSTSSASGAAIMPYFLDPRTSAGGPNVPETDACSQARSLLWYYIIAAFASQPSLLNGIVMGDIAAVIARLEDVDAKNPVTELAQALHAVCTCAAVPAKKVSFPALSTAFTHLDHLFSRDRPEGMGVGPRLLPALFMEAISSDSRYSVEHALMSKEPPKTLAVTIHTLVNVVRVPARQEPLAFVAEEGAPVAGTPRAQHGKVHGAGNQGQGRGQGTGAPHGSGTGGRKSGPCYRFKDKGECNVPGCPWAHDEASMNACTLPARYTTPRTPSVLTCPVCNENHAVSLCPIVVAAKASSKPTGYAAIGIAPAAAPTQGQGITQHATPSSLPHAPATFSADQVGYLLGLQRAQTSDPNPRLGGHMAAPTFEGAERPMADVALQDMLAGGDR